MLLQFKRRHPDVADPSAVTQHQRLDALLWPVLGLGSLILMLGTPLAFAPRYPLLLAEPAIALGALAGVGAVLIALSLHHPRAAGHIPVRLLAQLSGWTITVGCLVLLARYPHNETPAALLFPVASAAARSGLTRLVRAVLIGEALLLGFAAAQRSLLHVSDSAGAQETFISWSILLLVVAVVARLAFRPRVAARAVPVPVATVAPAPESAAPASASLAPRALLSPREREILPYLATYYKIPRLAAALDIKPATIKSHQEHIGAKLGTPDGERSTIVAEAKARGLLGDEEVRQAEASVREALAARRAAGGTSHVAGGTSGTTETTRGIAPERGRG